MCGECEQTLGEASATNNVCAGGYVCTGVRKIFFLFVRSRATHPFNNYITNTSLA
jgi:hypothetical protein